MAQTDDFVNIGASCEYNQYGRDEAITLGTSFANILEIDCKKLRSVTVNIQIVGGAIDGDYIVYGTTKRNPTMTVTEDEWAIVKVSTALTRDVTTIDTFTGNYTKLIVQAKGDSGTPAAKAWYKGKN